MSHVVSGAEAGDLHGNARVLGTKTQRGTGQGTMRTQRRCV